MGVNMEQPYREVFWNISYSWLFYILAAVASLVFFYGIYKRAAFWMSGWSERRNGGVDLKRLTKKVLFTSGIFSDDIMGGTTHFLIMWGFIVLFLGTVLSTIDHWIFHFLEGEVYIVYSVSLDIAGAALITGIILAYVRRYIVKRKNMVTIVKDHVVLLLLLFIAITGFFMEGLRLHANPVPWSESRVAYRVADAIFHGSRAHLLFEHRLWWWIHSISSLFLVAYLPFSKFIHIFAAPTNLTLDSMNYTSFLTLDEREKVTTDFSKHQLVMFDACTRCNRCQVVCPSSNAREPLSPRMMIEEVGNYARGASGIPFVSSKRDADQHDKATASLGDTIWYCTTCNNCYEVCPVGINTSDIIREVRAARIESGGEVPVNVQEMLESVYKFKNPWQGSKGKRMDWAEGLDVPVFSKGADSKRCLFVGCTPAYDTRLQSVARNVVSLLEGADYDFAVLGEEEACCSEFVREVGEDGLFTELAYQNIDLFERYGITEIVAVCPHGFHTLRNEYGLMEDSAKRLDVVHITEVLERLIADGRIKPTREVPLVATYHDPCFLGRRNGIYDAPRNILRAIPGVKLVEMPRSREKSFCCGGGGGRMWVESNADEKIAEIRVAEAVETGAEVVVTACPFCFSNLDDAVKTGGYEDKIKVMDVSELLAESVLEPGSS